MAGLLAFCMLVLLVVGYVAKTQLSAQEVCMLVTS